jgi:hypothetical protein
VAKSIDWGQLSERLRKEGVTGKLGVWTRTDIANRSYRTSSKGGPDWKQVEWRATYEEATGELLDLEHTDGITRDREHRPLCKWPTRTTTALITREEEPTLSATARGIRSMPRSAESEGECKDEAVTKAQTIAIMRSPCVCMR